MKKNLMNLFCLYASIGLLFFVMYLVQPGVFLLLFKTGLGNLFLLGIVVLVGFISLGLSLAVGIKFLIVFLIVRWFIVEEGLMGGVPQYMKKDYSIPGGWPEDLVSQFLTFQQAHNPNIFFDMDMIQKQATADEAAIFLKNGSWPWSADIQRLYRDAIARNSYISMNPGTSLRTAQTVYNQHAIEQLLSWNTKEGDFLLGGVVIGHTDGLPKNINNVVRCAASVDGPTEMHKTVYTGYNGINGQLDYRTTVVPNEEIPNVVPGFSFLAEKGVCNPCAPLNSPPDYSCPFIINVGNGTYISQIWEKLWNLNSDLDLKKKKYTFPATNNSYLLGVSRKKNNSDDNLVLNMNTNF
jgi:hypothetical protein